MVNPIDKFSCNISKKVVKLLLVIIIFNISIIYYFYVRYLFILQTNGNGFDIKKIDYM